MFLVMIETDEEGSGGRVIAQPEDVTALSGTILDALHGRGMRWIDDEEAFYGPPLINRSAAIEDAIETAVTLSRAGVRGGTLIIPGLIH